MKTTTATNPIDAELLAQLKREHPAVSALLSDGKQLWAAIGKPPKYLRRVLAKLP